MKRQATPELPLPISERYPLFNKKKRDVHERTYSYLRLAPNNANHLFFGYSSSGWSEGSD